MQRPWGILVTCTVATCLALSPACRRSDAPTTQPSAPQRTPPAVLLAPESHAWSQDEATAHLGDDKLGLSAAVRLVQLSEQQPLCVPESPTDALLGRLRLVHLNRHYWALGLADRTVTDCLRAPVLITAAGDVEVLADDVEEEMLVLHVSDDPDVFPHLVILPQTVLLVEAEITSAVALQPNDNVRFELRTQAGYPYIALLLLHGEPDSEAARYLWEPYELVLTGPACDSLPEPPGGKLNVDMASSLRFEPVGGELPEPIPIPEPAPTSPVPSTPWIDKGRLPT